MRRSPLRSPPRMRGKAKNRCRSCPLTRITPACAGKRTCTATRRCGNGNHPRVCGDKFTVRFTRMVLPGSPPRMRGKDPVAHSCKGCVGITPAYAGKRRAGTGQWACRRDPPPRVRGKAHAGRQVLRGLRRHLKCDWDGHLRLVQVGNVVHERALMPDVHESQPRRTPQRHNDRMGQPVQAGMHGGSHGCRGRAAAPKCPPPGSERYPFHPLR